jgi:hypothetical protein
MQQRSSFFPRSLDRQVSMVAMLFYTLVENDSTWTVLLHMRNTGKQPPLLGLLIPANLLSK